MSRVGIATQLEVLLHDSVDCEIMFSKIDVLLHGSPVATDTQPKGGFQAKSLGDLAQLIAVTHYLGVSPAAALVWGGALVVLKLTDLSISAEAVTIAFTPSIRLATLGLAVSAMTGLLAGIAPAWHAARTEIVPALRQT